ncbi:MAG: tRNA pseudouridine(38-40) synthase TruA [Acidobacteria bacterium]|nr:tRNA pseudouridine(38-40) synthase TruA [Acidobacteriota bacterium]MBK8148314.1 tRNA pseudouridine(38-40) synthase TruA [Acidobacteriota bacterium]MBK8813407.1 tRNA pseudouridine(38-40) synthase TruA [Acidobacteriota bacterium]
MPTWKLEIEYEGTRYRGWQIQHNAKSVQGELMAVAHELFSSRVEIGGSGRTDAGVHAIAQIAHLKVPELKANVTPRQIQHGFNDLLPHDINIKKVLNAPDDFNARHDAVSRSYLYQISTRRTAFGKNFVWWIKDQLDPKAMQIAAEMLVGRHDFASFCEQEEGKKQSTTVVVERSEIFVDGDLICFRIAASHFLWKMVRRVTGMLAEVGRGNLGYDGFQRLLKFPSNVPAKFTSPPSGLFLESVTYKGEKPGFEPKSVFPVR